MKKRGQLTIFVIISIIIFFAIILYYSLHLTPRNTPEENFLKGTGLSEKTSLVRSNIFSCIDSTFESTLVHIGIQGGHNTKPKKYFSSKDLDEYKSFFSYFYYEGENLMPKLEEIEYSFSSYFEENLPNCLESKNYPLNVSFTTPLAKTIITNEKIDIELDLKISLEIEETKLIIDLKDEQFSYPSRLYSMIEIAEYLTDYHKIDPIFFCINCLDKMAYDRGVSAHVVSFVENNTRQVIMFEERPLNSYLYIFTYLNKYTGEEKSPIFDEV